VFQKVAGMLIVTFAFYTFSSGLAIKGVSKNIFNSRQEQSKTAEVNNNKDEPQADAGEQLVEMHVTSRGFEPAVIKVKQGVPVRWVIKGDNITGCTNKIIIPSLNIEKPLKFGDNIVTFTPQKTGDLPFSCWMGMVRGKFVVE
jgi:plastocyanin domain-containing protein